MKKAVIFLLVLHYLPAAAQKNYSFLLHKTYPQRCRQLDSLFYPVNQEKDSAVITNELEQVAALARSENDEQLYLETVFLQLRLVNITKDNSNLNNSNFEIRLKRLIQQADENNFLQLSIQARNQLGVYYFNAMRMRNLGSAIEQFLNAYYLMKDVPVTLLPDKRDYVYNDLSTIYYLLGDYDNAKKFLREADSLPVYPIPWFSKMRGVINVSNTLGLIYRNTARYDSAEFYFKKAYGVAVAEKDSIWVGIAEGNIGITYFLQKRYAEAIPLLETDVRLSVSGLEWGNAANSLMKLVEINLKKNDKPKARLQMLRARSYISGAIDPIRHLDNFYPLMGRLCQAEGNMEMAYRYADSALLIRDTAAQLKSGVALARAQQKTDIEHHKLEVQVLEYQRSKQAIIRNWLLSMLLLLIAITLLLIGRQRLLKKQKQLAEDKEKLAVNELNSARQQLHNFTHNIREKNDLIDRLTTEMNDRQTNLNKEAITYRQETLEQLRQSTILTEEEWEAFKISFEKVYPFWFQKLNGKLPGLSAADLRFLALTRLKFNAKEMAAVLGISPASLRMSRHRLRKKYNLAEEDSLEQLAESV